MLIFLITGCSKSLVQPMCVAIKWACISEVNDWLLVKVGVSNNPRCLLQKTHSIILVRTKLAC